MRKRTLKDKVAVWVKERSSLQAAASIMRGKQTISLDYPIRPEPRYGYGRPLHPQLFKIISAENRNYREQLKKFQSYRKDFADISLEEKSNTAPYWLNPFIPALDAISLYSFVSLQNPAAYVEIGSGISTRFVRQAIQDRKLNTKITSIDPSPRRQVASIADSIIPAPLENLSPSFFTKLRADDILFVDNSHHSFQNSDVTAFFLDVLPALAPGVTVGIHDIFLPYDYPPAYRHNFYSEQYLLAAYLLGGGAHLKPAFPAWFISQSAEFKTELESLFSFRESQKIEQHGVAFWFTITA